MYIYIYMYVYIYINMCVHIHLAYSTFQLTHFVSLQSWSPMIAQARSRASRGCSLAWSASKRCPVEGPLDCHELTTGMDRKYQMIKQLTCGHTHWLDMGWDYPIKSKNVVHAHPMLGQFSVAQWAGNATVTVQGADIYQRCWRLQCTSAGPRL